MGEEEMPQCVDNHTQLCPWIELSSSCSYGLSSAHPAHMGSGTRGCPLPFYNCSACWPVSPLSPLSGTFWYFHLCTNHQADTYGHPTKISQSQRKFPFLSVVLSSFLYLSYFPSTGLTTTRLLLSANAFGNLILSIAVFLNCFPMQFSCTEHFYIFVHDPHFYLSISSTGRPALRNKCLCSICFKISE